MTHSSVLAPALGLLRLPYPNHQLPQVGEFQSSVLEVVANREESKRYVASIRKILGEKLGRPVSQPQVYTALAKLEERGFITSAQDKKATAGRRGRPRRIYSLTAAGRRLYDANVSLSKQLRQYGTPYATSEETASTT